MKHDETNGPERRRVRRARRLGAGRALALILGGVFATALAIEAVSALTLDAQDSVGDKPPVESPFRIPKHQYTGVKMCKTCHSKEKLGGEEYPVWEKLAHAKAYKTLASPAAKKIAAERGIADPQKDPSCLKCHTVAHGVEDKWRGKRLTLEEGVSCEACHGPGDDYKSRKVMEDHDASLAAGMVVPNEKTCRACHNEESPTYREFDYEKSLAKIRHWPEKK